MDWLSIILFGSSNKNLDLANFSYIMHRVMRIFDFVQQNCYNLHCNCAISIVRTVAQSNFVHITFYLRGTCIIHIYTRNIRVYDSINTFSLVRALTKLWNSLKLNNSCSSCVDHSTAILLFCIKIASFAYVDHVLRDTKSHQYNNMRQARMRLSLHSLRYNTVLLNSIHYLSLSRKTIDFTIIGYCVFVDFSTSYKYGKLLSS